MLPVRPKDVVPEVVRVLPVAPKAVVPAVRAVVRVLPVAPQAVVPAGAVLPREEVRSVVVPAPSVGERWSAAAVRVRCRVSAPRPVWVVFDRSSRNPALSH